MGGSATSPPNIAGSMPQARKFAAEVYRISTAEGRVLVPTEATADYHEEDGGIAFRSIFPRPAAGPLRFEAPFLARIPHYHRATVVMWNEANKRLGWTALDTKAPSAELLLPPDTSPSSQPILLAPDYMKRGLEQFLVAFALVPFLCALLVVCRLRSQAISVIVGFTLARWLSLTLSALDVFANLESNDGASRYHFRGRRLP